MLPLVPNAKGVKAPCSMSSTRCKYSLFFSISWVLKIVEVAFPAWLEEFTCVTLMSKNAVYLLCQKPPALMSRRDSSSLFADLKLNVSWVTGSRRGSASTSLHTLPNKFVNISLSWSCLWATKLPFLQLRACSTLNLLPQGQCEGRFFSG